jgi:hypothetical protein
MSNNEKVMYRSIAAEAGTYAAIGFGLNMLEGVVRYIMRPDVLVEEKQQLRENREILRKNFTK